MRLMKTTGKQQLSKKVAKNNKIPKKRLKIIILLVFIKKMIIFA
jgi:hypothetical protein